MDKKPEKQEEWREELKEIIKKSYFKLGRTGHSGVINMLEDFISQLLSERTFTKGELIKITQVFSHYEVCSGGLMEEDRKIVEKISKLLKE
jgi:hypothetical protein